MEKKLKKRILVLGYTTGETIPYAVVKIKWYYLKKIKKTKLKQANKQTANQQRKNLRRHIV